MSVGGDEFESEPQQGGRGNSEVQNLFGMLLFNIMRRKNIVCEATHHHHLTGLRTSSSMPQTRSLFQVMTPYPGRRLTG